MRLAHAAGDELGVLGAEVDDQAGVELAGGVVQGPPKKRVRASRLESKVCDALGPVRFFEPSRYGIAVAPDKGGVRVKAADREKPLGKAGLRAGDLVLALDGTPADSPESFRRLLRRRVAEGGEAVFRVRRGGKEAEVRATLP